jgi:phospholipid/cholesterol/gamma-HCH transport system substrate-binding protein
VGGVEVGTVKDVEFDRAGSGMVEVSMELDRRVEDRVTSASRATIGTLGLLGEKAVDITAAPGGTPLRDQQYITAAADDPFKGLLADAGESTQLLKRILARMDAGEGTIGKALRDEELYDRMNDVAVRLQAVMARLESPRGPLGRLVNDERMADQMAASVRSLHAVAARVEAGRGPLGVLTQDDEMAREIKAITRSMDDVARRLRAGEGTMGRLLKDDALYRRLETLAARLDTVMGRLEGTQGTAGRLMNDPQLYDNMNAAARDVRGLVSDMRRDPQKYLRVKLSLF